MNQPTKARMETPEVIIPAVRSTQPDGSILFKPGKPIVVNVEIGTRETARLLGMSLRWVISECELGRFKTAHKPGLQITSHWKIARSEVLARKELEPS